MDFNFYKEYKQYPTVELLKITRQPAAYQLAALDAAKKVLAEREVSAADIEAADQYFNDATNKKQAKQEKIDAYTNKASDILEPIIKPSNEIEPVKWLNIFLVFITMLYGWSFYNTVTSAILLFNCRTCSFDITSLLMWLPLAYIPVMIYLLFKKRRWGWIILYSDNLFTLISRISSLYIFFKYQSVLHTDVLKVFLPIILHIFFAVFLWQEKIAGLFNISAETKKKTTAVVAGATIFFMIMVSIIYR